MTHAATHRDAPDAPSRSPLVEMLIIAAPTVATMTSYTAMQFVDAMMVSKIQPPDPMNLAAQGNGGILAFIPIGIVMGLTQVINTYVSQNFGAGRPERGSAYAWNGLWLALLAQLALIPYALALPWFMGLMDHDPRLVELEAGYGQVLLMGAFFTMSTRGIAHFFYGLHRPMTVFFAALTGNAVNIFSNWVFIYGNLGAPALGVDGAAVGTIIGTAVELAVCMAIFLSPRYNRLFGTRGVWRPSLPHIRDIFRIGWPPALMFGSEIICWGYFMAQLVGRFGTDHNTAGWIGLRYMHLSFMPAVGLSIAVTAMVGKAMGMKRPDLAARRAYLGIGLTMGYMGACALGFLVFGERLIAVFVDGGTDPQTAASILRIGAWVMVIAAVFQLFDAMAITISGALRGAGDTVWPGVLTVILSWTMIVGGGHAMIALAPDLESLGPWIASAAYVIALGSLLAARFIRGRWKQIDLLGHSAATAGCDRCGRDRASLDGHPCPDCGAEPLPAAAGPAA